MNSDVKSLGAVKKSYDTRQRRRAETMADLTSTRRQEDNSIDENLVSVEEQPRQVQTTTEEPCSRKFVDNNDNVSYRASIKSKKSTKNSRSTSKTERRRLEIEAERQILEIEKKLILNKLALDKLTVNEDFEDIEESEVAEECNSVADYISFKVSTWLKSNPAPEVAISDMERETEVNKIKELAQGNDTTYRDTNFVGKFQTNDMENCIMRRYGMDRSLPNFDGNPADWLVFISEFTETSKLCNYSDSENLVRLRKCLKGEARESVKMLLISHLNVSEIIETLENNYGRPQYIIKYMIEQVKCTPPIKDYKPESIVKFANSVCNLVTAIKHLENDVYLKNPILLDEFISLLTISLKRDWSLHAIKLKEPTLLDFSIWLKNFGKASGLLCTPNFKNDHFNSSKKSESVLLTDDRKKVLKDKCRCCGNIKHLLDKCQKFQEMNVDNRWLYVSKNKLCISCLKPNHHLSTCYLKKKCGINNCQLKHTPLLHKECEIGAEVNVPQQNHETETIEPIQIHQQKYSQIILRTIPVEIEGPKGKKTIYALLDEGSTITLLDKDLATDIGLTGCKEPLCMQWTNNQHQTDNSSQKVSLNIRGKFSHAKSYVLKDVRTINNLMLPSQSLDMKMVAEQWPYLKNLPINSFKDVRPKMLIGTDNYDLTMPRHFVESTRYDPKATLTKLGWVVNGQIVRGKIENTFSFHVCERNLNDDMLHSFIQDTYKLHDNLDSDIPLSRQDQYALTIMENTTNRLKQYVRNRVQKILESSDKTSCRWLPTKLNPADHATRDENPKNSQAKWLTGPEFLHQPFSQWSEGILDANFDKSEMIKKIKIDKNEFVGPHYNKSENNVPKNFPTGDDHLRKQWKINQNLSNTFWSRWIKEYLLTLHTRSKWNEDHKKIKINDVVIIVDDQNHRNLWLKGKVIAVYPGKDGRIRVAEVQTSAGVYRRPVSKLCILQITHPNEAV